MSTPPPPSSPQQPQPGAAGAPSSDDRNWGVIAHLSALVMVVSVPSFIGPLVVWLIKRDQHPFVAEHGREALNFNLSLLLYAVAGVILGVVTLGVGFLLLIPLAIVVLVLWLVFLIQAAMAASRGESYRYPLTVRFIS